jgi:hypothetical protein
MNPIYVYVSDSQHDSRAGSCCQAAIKAVDDLGFLTPA